MEARAILLIDTDADSLHIYSLMLEHHGFRALCSRDAGEGFRLAATLRPDLVVAELFMPPVEGHPLAEVLRRDARTASLPLIGITSLPVYAPYRTSLAACDSVLVKPCAPSRLLQEVRRQLEGAQTSSPRSTVTAWPPSSTRSPAQRARTIPPLADTW